ncbi:MAG: hypothetical protein CMP47_07810 [Rickettsiales bacterium]|nr:hypothetical protein [Rickettsiales bacterium]
MKLVVREQDIVNSTLLAGWVAAFCVYFGIQEGRTVNELTHLRRSEALLGKIQVIVPGMHTLKWRTPYPQDITK